MLSLHHDPIQMASPAGFKPATSSLEAKHSVRAELRGH